MIRFEANGREVSVDRDADTPIAYVLRSDLGLFSVKLGCEAEQCGACRVLIDGEPRYACTVELAEVEGRSVTTLEGLGETDALSAVQQALLTHNATQCGYCLSGIAIAAHALFAAEPSPTRDAIVAALEPHLCRCGAHPRVLRALLELAGDG